MRVLITGHRGYVGSVLVGVLRHQRFEVSGLDCDLYQSCDFGRVQGSVPSFEIDVRDVEFTDLLSFDAVVHLAALPEGLSEPFDHRLIDGHTAVQFIVRVKDLLEKPENLWFVA